MTVVVDLLIIAVLLALGLGLTYQRPRTWLIAALRSAAVRYGQPEHTPDWELEHAELWLMARRRQLSEDLGRIERLLLHDATMSATRQLGNRLARDQLIASLARLPEVLPGQDRYVAHEPVGAFLARPGSTELLDVGGWR